MAEKADESEDLKERKRRERLEQNRISARESRKRKKTMIEELQRTVIGLSRENKDLNERNEGFRRELMELGAKYPQVVPLHAIMGAGTIDPTLSQTQNPPPAQNGNQQQQQQAQQQQQLMQQQQQHFQILQQQQQQLQQQQIMQPQAQQGVPQPAAANNIYFNNANIQNGQLSTNMNVPEPTRITTPASASAPVGATGAVAAPAPVGATGANENANATTMDGTTESLAQAQQSEPTGAPAQETTQISIDQQPKHAEGQNKDVEGTDATTRIDEAALPPEETETKAPENGGINSANGNTI